jgi:hypothetical protein
MQEPASSHPRKERVAWRGATCVAKHGMLVKRATTTGALVFA